ncbi:MAG: DsbA family protein [Candidatus Acidiferrales bacterium]
MGKGILVIPFLLAALCGPQSSTKAPDANASPTGTGISQEQAAKIVEELQTIRMLLEEDLNSRSKEAGHGPVAGTEPEIASTERTLTGLGEHVLGKDTAPVTLVEFLDLECPFCIWFHNVVFPEIRREYIDTGKLRFVVFSFPLPSHPYSDPAARLVDCAGLQGKYWSVFDAFLDTPHIATPEIVAEVANRSKLDEKALGSCMEGSAIRQALKRDEDSAHALGVNGTPTFLLGKSRGDGVSGQLIEGAPSASALEGMIEELLSPGHISREPSH